MPGASAGFNVNVQKDELSSEMRLVGMCQLSMLPEHKLVLKAMNGSGKQGVWPVWLLRRYACQFVTLDFFARLHCRLPCKCYFKGTLGVWVRCYI